MTDFADWQAPQAHAQAINQTGVPLIRNITVIRNTNVFSAGSSFGPVNTAYSAFYEGYLLEVIPQNPGTRVFAVDLVISHVDSSGNTVAVEQVTLSNFQNLGNNTSVVRGRLLGTTLSLSGQVAASAWINTVTGSAVTADSIVVRLCGLQTYLPGSSKRIPVIQTSDGMLLGSSTTVALGAVAGVETLISVLPDYTGPVVVHSFTGFGGGFLYQPRIKCYTVSGGTTTQSVIDFPNVSNTATLIQAVSLPSTFNLASVVQRSTVAQAAGYGVVINDADQ